MPDCVLANRTDLDRAVDRILLVFGSLSGFALVKFLTGPTMLKEPDGPWIVWPLAVALTGFLLRFILGTAIHLNQRFVKDVPNSAINTRLICLLIKDLFFIIAFGLIAVGLTECQSIDTFVLWSTVFVALGFFWGVIDWLARGRAPPGALEKAWLIIDFIQTIWFSLFLIWRPELQSHYIKAIMFAVVSVFFLIADINELVKPKATPARA